MTQNPRPIPVHGKDPDRRFSGQPGPKKTVQNTKIGTLRLKTIIYNAITALDQGLVGEAKEILRRGLHVGGVS